MRTLWILLFCLSACTTEAVNGDGAPGPSEPSRPSMGVETAQFPDGVVIESTGYLTVLSSPEPAADLFPTEADRSAARWGMSVEEAARRDALLRDLMRKKEYWWNAMLDREPGMLVDTYMDWDAVGETGDRGVEVVLLRSDFPEATLSWYVTHPNIRGVNADAERARLLDLRDDYVAELRARGIGVDIRERTARQDARLIVNAPNGEGLPTPPPGQTVEYAGTPKTDGVPAFADGMSAYFRTDQRIAGGFGPVIQPANPGKLIARDGCLYIQTRSGEHIAVLPPWQTLGRDREGWPALLDEAGFFQTRLGTQVTFAGGARQESHPPGTPCPGATAMDLPGVGNDRPRPDWVDIQLEPPR